MYSKFRGETPISDIENKKKVKIAGRILSITADAITVGDESGIIVLLYDKGNLKCLDIAVFDLVKKKRRFYNNRYPHFNSITGTDTTKQQLANRHLE